MTYKSKARRRIAEQQGTASAARIVYANSSSEDELQKFVTDLLDLRGWWWHHAGDSRRSSPGLLDIVAVRPPRVIFAELKTRVGRLRAEQVVVIDKLRDCPGVEVYLWRPMDLDDIQRILE